MAFVPMQVTLNKYNLPTLSALIAHFYNIIVQARLHRYAVKARIKVVLHKMEKSLSGRVQCLAYCRLGGVKCVSIFLNHNHIAFIKVGSTYIFRSIDLHLILHDEKLNLDHKMASRQVKQHERQHDLQGHHNQE